MLTELRPNLAVRRGDVEVYCSPSLAVACSMLSEGAILVFGAASRR